MVPSFSQRPDLKLNWLCQAVIYYNYLEGIINNESILTDGSLTRKGRHDINLFLKGLRRGEGEGVKN